MHKHTMLTIEDLRTLKEAICNVFAPGVETRYSGLQRLQERGLVSTQRTYAFERYVDVTEAGYALAERAGITVHRPLGSWYQDKGKAA